MSCDISVGLLEFKPTDENLIRLGRLVWEKLNNFESEKADEFVIEGKKHWIKYREVIVHGS